MSPLVNFDVLNLVNGPVLLFVFAEDRGVVFKQDSTTFIKHHQLYLASVHKNNSKTHDKQ
jgi:hypothetical protein